MKKVRIWTLESDYDAEAVKYLTDGIKNHLQLNNIDVHVVGKRAIPKKDDGLRMAVRNYLKEDDYIIFVIDSDGPIANESRKRQPNSLTNQIQAVIFNESFNGHVFRADAVCELEAWLLIDCLGIISYFLNGRLSREEIRSDADWSKLINKYQNGKTDLIVEAQMGGKGVKEFLARFSKDILRKINPKMPIKNVDQKKYCEAFAPLIAEYIVIDAQTIQRNDSFKRFSKLLRKFDLNDNIE